MEPRSKEQAPQSPKFSGSGKAGLETRTFRAKDSLSQRRESTLRHPNQTSRRCPLKRGTPRHRKMRDLAKRLGVPLYSAVGIMEMLWHWAGQETPRGDIGTADDDEIAAAVCWKKKPTILINALVESRWLERHAEYRLIIHDWPDHADQAARKWLSRKGHNFLPVYEDLSGHGLDKNQDKVIQNGSPHAQVRAGLASACSSSESSEVSSDGKGVQGEGEQMPRTELVAWKDAKFEEFWDVVWAKIGKDAARKAWKVKATNPEIADQIIVAAKEQGRSILEHAARYDHSVLHPSTWINSGRYLDEIQPELVKETQAERVMRILEERERRAAQ